MAVAPEIKIRIAGSISLLSLKNDIKRLLDDRLEIDPDHCVIRRIISQRIRGSGISLALEFKKQFNYSVFFGYGYLAFLFF